MERRFLERVQLKTLTGRRPHLINYAHRPSLVSVPTAPPLLLSSTTETNPLSLSRVNDPTFEEDSDGSSGTLSGRDLRKSEVYVQPERETE